MTGPLSRHLVTSTACLFFVITKCLIPKLLQQLSFAGLSIGSC